MNWRGSRIFERIWKSSSLSFYVCRPRPRQVFDILVGQRRLPLHRVRQ